MILTHNAVKHRMLQDPMTRPLVVKFAEEYHKTKDLAQALETVLPDYIPGATIVRLLNPVMTEKEEWHNMDQDFVEKWMNT